MRVLVVGAGAVGQVYGRHLQLGGAEVTCFVRDKYRAAAERGFDLYVLRRGRAPSPVRFEGFEVVSRIDEVAARQFDQVYLTVSSAGLTGPWLAELIAATGDATIVALQPGDDDRTVLRAAGVPDARLVSGMLTLVSYAAPLPGETRFPRPGMAYWFPPLAPSPMSGPRAGAAVAALRAGHLPAKRHRDVPRAAAFPSAILMPLLVALERAGWSLAALARGDALALGVRGAREALTITAASTGRRISLGARLMARPRVLRLALALARRFMPFPLEVYLHEHFTKVRAQTSLFMTTYLAKARLAGLAVPALEQLTSPAALPAPPPGDT